MAGKARQTFARRIIRWGTLLLSAVLLLSVLQVLLLRWINPPFTMVQLWGWFSNDNGPRGRLLTVGWRELGEISPHLRRAVLAAEDQRFLSHHGFDFAEMNKAIKDMAHGGRVRGASTITMQAARTVFLNSDRNIFRKTAEAYYTVLMELLWGKERILEVYLNTVDWGPGIRGAQAASLAYFDMPCSRLTRSRAALLAAALPNPHQWSPAYPGQWILKRQGDILRDMNKMPLLDG